MYAYSKMILIHTSFLLLFLFPDLNLHQKLYIKAIVGLTTKMAKKTRKFHFKDD